MITHAYVVESPAVREDGSRMGTCRVYVATEQRARIIAGGGPDRMWRQVPVGEIPDHARANLEQARAAALAHMTT